MTPFLLLAFFLAPQDKPPDKCTVAGTAVNAATGEPLAKVQVYLEPEKRDAPLATTVTDAKGAFSLVNVDPGAYRLKAVRNGFIEAYYGARRAGGKGAVLNLQAGDQPGSLDLRLTPFGVVAGMVTDPEGEPLAGVRVRLLAVTYEDGSRRVHAADLDYQSGLTDDLGQYRIAGVRPGRYYVRAAPPRTDHQGSAVDHSPDGRQRAQMLLPTFHPSSRELEGARRIDITPGARFTGADISLLRSRMYRVRVHASWPPGTDFGIALEDKLNFGDGFDISPNSHAIGQGVYEFWGVPSGSYLVRATIVPPNQVFSGPDDMFFNSHEFRTVAPVDVVNGDVDDVRIVAQSGAEVSGRVAVAEPRPAEFQPQVRFIAGDGGGRIASANADGTFTSLLSPGRYEVQAFGGGDLVVKSMRTETADVLAEGLTITGAGKVTLDVLFSHEAARVEGAVSDKDDKPASGATVVLIPESKLRFRHDLFQQAQTDQNGRFHFDTVAPGDYKVLAWEDVEPGIWFDPDFLKDAESAGAALTVHPKGQETAKLKVIAAQ